jgi:hypothetical protein
LSHLKTGSLALKRFFENPPKSKCKACNGTGRVPDKNWREKFEGYDSFGNPMMIPVYEVTGTRRCPLCNGMGIYPP